MSNKIKNLAIMGVTKENQANEKALVKNLISKVSQATDGEIQLKDISTYEGVGEIRNVVSRHAGGVILVTDAAFCEISKEYDAAACALYEAGIEPLILVVENPEGNIIDAAYVAVNVIDYIDPDKDSSTVWYDTVYYRVTNDTFFSDPENVEERDITIFIQALEKYGNRKTE